MRKSRCIVLVFGLLLISGCGDDGGDPEGGGHAGNASPVKPDSGIPVAGTGGGGFGFAGSPAFPPCFGGMPCMCFDCGGGCVDCGLGCNCGGGGAGAPQPLPWDPPFDAVGAPGWKASEAVFCSGMDQVSALDVWSDERGVFAMVSGAGLAPIDPDPEPDPDEDAGVSSGAAGFPGPDVNPFHPGGYAPRTQVWFNDGSGWGPSVDAPGVSGQFALTGLPESSLILNEYLRVTTFHPDFGEMLPLASTRCALGMLNGTALECFDLDPVQSVIAAGPDRAYAVMGGTRLLEFDGDQWRSNTALIPYPVSALWADETSVLGLGNAGTVLWLEQGTWTLQDPGTLANLTSVWGTSRSNLWVGTSQGAILHYDGETWAQVGQLGGVTCSNRPAVIGIWGSGDDEVYFHSQTHLARWNGSEIETLANWSCAQTASFVNITGLWGHAPDEVFLSIVDNSRVEGGGCGPAHVVHYDGQSFHRM